MRKTEKKKKNFHGAEKNKLVRFGGLELLLYLAVDIQNYGLKSLVKKEVVVSKIIYCFLAGCV